MSIEEVVILIPSHGLEDFPYELEDEKAEGLLNAFAVAWHPRLLATATRLPRWEPADQPMSSRPRQLVIVPEACDGYLSETWPDRARAAGATVITGMHDRHQLVQAILSHCADAPPFSAEQADLASDFLAFGTAHLHQELLTREMRNYSQIEHDVLLQHVQTAARSLLEANLNDARQALTRAFEMLLECRERYYPSECWLIDLCLVAPDQAGEELRQLVQSGHPTSLLAPHHGWPEILNQDEALTQLLKVAAEKHQVEIIGGQRESLDSLLSLDANVHSLLSARRGLTDKLQLSPATWGRKRFGLHWQLPQLLARCGYSTALHFLLDDGISPEDEAALLRWQGGGGVEIAACNRLPIAVDSPSSFIRFARQMAEAMDYDHAAALVLLHWPRRKTPFLDDLIRAQRYQPVFGKFTTFHEFVSRASVPGRRLTPAAAGYRSPTLTQAVRRQTADPVSRLARWWERERRWQRADWLRTIAAFLLRQAPVQNELESVVRAAHPECAPAEEQAAETALRESLLDGGAKLAGLLTSNGSSGTGVLVLNTHAFPRRAVVEWPAGTMPPAHPLVKTRQVEAQRAWGLVELPPCGFTWLPAEPRTATTTPPGKPPLAEGMVLRTDAFEVRLSPVTGGIGQVATYRRSPNRISQQVALRYGHERPGAKPEGDAPAVPTHYSVMRLREARVLSAGPLRGEIETVGDLRDEGTGQLLGVYRQVTRTTRGRNDIEVELEIGLQEPVRGDAWEDDLCVRFAWAHEEVTLSASMQEGTHACAKTRVEAAQAIEICDDAFRTTILTPGQPYFRKSGERMLDMLLCPPGESSHHFRFAIAIDAAYPQQAQLEAFAPPVVVTTSNRPAEGARQGWFVSLSAANVQLQRILPGIEPGEYRLRLLETEGRAQALKVNLCHPVHAARKVDFLGQPLEQLTVTGEGVEVQIAAYELCEVAIQLHLPRS